MASETEGYWGLSAKRCDSCKCSPAVLFCRADTAYLCGTCDARVHGANRLASRHERVWMCEVCEQAPASVMCKADAATLCVTCDADIHAANPLARRHERVPVVPIYDPISSVFKPSAASAVVGCGGEEENESEAADTWIVNSNRKPKLMSEATPDLNFFSGVDPYLDLDCADSLVPVQGKPLVGAVIGVCLPPPPPPPPMTAPEGVRKFDFALAKPSDSSCNGHPLSHSVSSSEAGVVPDGGCNASADVSHPYCRPLVAIDREARVMRYREKRKNRKFEKTIRYASRKAYAETRPRIKGRFAKRVEMDSDLDRILASSSLLMENRWLLRPSPPVHLSLMAVLRLNHLLTLLR